MKNHRINFTLIAFIGLLGFGVGSYFSIVEHNAYAASKKTYKVLNLIPGPSKAVEAEKILNDLSSEGWDLETSDMGIVIVSK